MNTPAQDTFEVSYQQALSLLKEIQTYFGWPDNRERAYFALRAVLHTLRDRMDIEEAADFASELPMLVRGLFYEGWDPLSSPVEMSSSTFLQTVQERIPYTTGYSSEELVQGVLSALSHYVSEEEMETLPQSVKYSPKH